MTERHILTAMTYIDSQYIDAAQKKLGYLSEEKKRKRRPMKLNFAAAIAVILMVVFFFQTPVGAKAAEIVQEQMAKIIEILFPPKKMAVTVEGETEYILHEAQGMEPNIKTPGFSIYVDTENYVMTVENGIYYIRPIPIQIDREAVRKDQADLINDLSSEDQEAAIDRRVAELEAYYASLPACELVIRELPDKDMETAAAETRADMVGKWDNLSDIWSYREPKTLHIDASSDNISEYHQFLENGNGGTFHLIKRGYTEAAEGHGTRLHYMMRTFTVIAPQDTSQYADNENTILEAMQQETNHVRVRNNELLRQLQNESLNQADMNAVAQERYDLWIDLHTKLWNALEQTQDTETMEKLLAGLLEWSTYYTSALDEIMNILDGGSLTDTAAYEKRAELLEARCDYMMNVLEGTAPVTEREQGIVLDPEITVKDFTDAYFSGDTRILQSYLSSAALGSAETYQGNGAVINAYKGMDDIVADMARRGRLDVSVEFRPTADSDYFVYLSITLKWENGQWRVASYGLEG